MLELLTPVVLPIQSDRPAARVVLLDENNNQVGPTAYSIQGFQNALYDLYRDPAQQVLYALSEVEIERCLASARPQMRDCGIPKELSALDLKRLAVCEELQDVLLDGDLTMMTSFFGLSELNEQSDRRCLSLHPCFPHMAYLVRIGARIDDIVWVHSAKMLQFTASMAATHSRLARYRVQDSTLIFLGLLIDKLSNAPEWALPPTHPEQDAVLLAQLSDECQQDLLDQYFNYAPPIG